MALTAGQVAYAAVSIVFGLTCLAMAAIVAWPRPRRAVSLYLSAFLAVTGLNAIVFYGPQAFADDAWLEINLSFWVSWTASTGIWIYALFFTAALTTPLVRPFRARAARLALLGIVASLPIAIFLWYQDVIVEPHPAVRAVQLLAHPSVWYAILAFAVLAGLDAYRRSAPGSPARRRAGAYLSAFLLFDLAQLVWTVTTLDRYWDDPAARPVAEFVNVVVGSAIAFLALGLLARAVLRERLFDLDLRLKVTLKRGTVAAAFLAVFLVVAQVVQNWLSDAMGYMAGGVAAGLLLLALAPIQRMAENVAGAALPLAQPTPAYVAFQKVQVYRAQVEQALADDGRLDEREREFLERLRASLGLTADDAVAIERDLLPRA